jgi:hypothetical protein
VQVIAPGSECVNGGTVTCAGMNTSDLHGFMWRRSKSRAIRPNTG